MGIIAGQVPQRMKHLLGVGINGTRNLFGGFSGVGGEFFARLLLKLQQSGRSFLPSLNARLIIGIDIDQ
jgi:hypothetical protein